LGSESAKKGKKGIFSKLREREEIFFLDVRKGAIRPSLDRAGDLLYQQGGAGGAYGFDKGGGAMPSHGDWKNKGALL